MAFFLTASVKPNKALIIDKFRNGFLVWLHKQLRLGKNEKRNF